MPTTESDSTRRGVVYVGRDGPFAIPIVTDHTSDGFHAMSELNKGTLRPSRNKAFRYASMYPMKIVRVYPGT